MKNNIDMRTRDLDITCQILAKYLPSNAVVWVFGSRAKGMARQYSDLPYKVDIVDWNSISDEFRAVVFNDRVILNFNGTTLRRTLTCRPVRVSPTTRRST